jgi:hypothetical protein
VDRNTPIFDPPRPPPYYLRSMSPRKILNFILYSIEDAKFSIECIEDAKFSIECIEDVRFIQDL